MTAAIDANEVARYLQANPDFFDQNAELLAHMYVPHLSLIHI